MSLPPPDYRSPSRPSSLRRDCEIGRQDPIRLLIATMGTCRGVDLALLAAVLLQTLLPASEADGLVQIALKKRPIDQNSRVATRLSSGEEAQQQLLLGGGVADTLYSEEEGDIVSLKNYMNAHYFREIGIGTRPRSSPSSRLRATSTHATRRGRPAPARRIVGVWKLLSPP